MSRQSVDVLVVGLGPAGGAAALAAAGAGLRVAAVERRKQVGVPVQCAELIPLGLAHHAKAEGVARQHVATMLTHLPSGKTVETASPGLMIDRSAFDQALARQAEEKGAALFMASRLVGLDAASSTAVVATAYGKLEFGYRLLIAADGPHSSVARLLGMSQLETVRARQYTVRLSRREEKTEIWLSPDYPGGYAWLFPKGEVANIGLGLFRNSAADPKKLLDALHSRLVGEGRVESPILQRTGGAIPVSGLRTSLVSGNVLFAGDAAGLTHPITGAGIAAAVMSGEHAGLAAAARLGGLAPHALQEYDLDVRDLYESSLQRALARRAWLGRHWQMPAAGEDGIQRRGWVAFPEYFATSYPE